MASVEPVVVHIAASTVDAQLILGMLTSNGIRAFLAGTGAETYTEAGQIGQMTGIPGPLNEIRIMVHPEDAADARAILEESAPVEPDTGDIPARWATDPAKRARAVKVIAVIVLIPLLYGIVAGLIELARNL